MKAFAIMWSVVIHEAGKPDKEVHSGSHRVECESEAHADELIEKMYRPRLIETFEQGTNIEIKVKKRELRGG